MKTLSPLSITATLIFLVGIIAAFFGYLNPGNMTLARTTLTISIVYLLSGWYLFQGYFPSAHPFLLFFFGFLYASAFMAFAFVIASWPLAKTFISVSPVWPLVLITAVLVTRKKLPKEGLIQFLIEAGIMLALTRVLIMVRY